MCLLLEQESKKMMGKRHGKGKKKRKRKLYILKTD